MTSMIERVGRIIEQAIIRHGVSEFELRGTIGDARRAIEAMRDLTMPMAVSGMEAMARDDLEPTEAEFTRGYQAAIDAALNEEEQRNDRHD